MDSSLFRKPFLIICILMELSLYDISLIKSRNYISISFKGDKFGREQIRRMVGFLIDQKYQDREVDTMLNQERINNHLEPAPGKFLVLFHVKFIMDIPWRYNEDESFQYFEKIKLSISKKLNELDFINDILSHGTD